MTDMKLVIKIDEKFYIDIKSLPFTTFAEDVIINGIPLPKGHGRLIDADRLRSKYSINRANFNTVVGIQKWIDDAPTIIEADKAESEEV